MKNVIVFVLLLNSLLLWAQSTKTQFPSSNKETLYNFDRDFIEGRISQLTEDSIYIREYGKRILAVGVDEIDYLKVELKPNFKGGGMILGAILGSIPGLFILTGALKSDGNTLNTVLSRTIGIPLAAVAITSGAILGGIIGNSLGKPKDEIFQINGSKSRYQKQAKAINQYAFY
jgi:hypothetical protein